MGKLLNPSPVIGLRKCFKKIIDFYTKNHSIKAMHSITNNGKLHSWTAHLQPPSTIPHVSALSHHKLKGQVLFIRTRDLWEFLHPAEWHFPKQNTLALDPYWTKIRNSIGKRIEDGRVQMREKRRRAYWCRLVPLPVDKRRGLWSN